MHDSLWVCVQNSTNCCSLFRGAGLSHNRVIDAAGSKSGSWPPPSPHPVPLLYGTPALFNTLDSPAVPQQCKEDWWGSLLAQKSFSGNYCTLPCIRESAGTLAGSQAC
ncbi:NADH-ubiquinone oxidoreductase 75 kDa subunit, mitochondrial [Platysternon megacephalum]|uniref:NADH-ubiquinone oxidoreductase 75 kDa subunit, mitochondrial n=1 Tax=Platysternon megacephalum TaxID=55544 RepID=A0A4D9EZH4_9SAUR|nr:NADH-ubiquinone oxidoreductase 75 kDa subunit, mitochondrial [Platysternon megacephalum]